MIELDGHNLTISFPEIDATRRQPAQAPRGSRGRLFARPMEDAPPPRLDITFQRTLRVPSDGREYPLPPGLGPFPLRHIDDYARTAPAAWRDRGGVILPMYQSEAMWISFEGERWGFAVQVAAGKVNALTGLPWTDRLQKRPLSYAVVPTQPWLDGFKDTTSTVRQFVAAPLGAGDTVEEQLTGAADVGGIQLAVAPMKPEAYWRSDLAEEQCFNGVSVSDVMVGTPGLMGIAAGGSIRQEVARDEYGIDSWDQSRIGRCFVHIVNSEEWRRITGEAPPHRPIGAREYNDAGLPWFEYYDERAVPINGSDALRGVRPPTE